MLTCSVLDGNPGLSIISIRYEFHQHRATSRSENVVKVGITNYLQQPRQIVVTVVDLHAVDIAVVVFLWAVAHNVSLHSFLCGRTLTGLMVFSLTVF